MERLLLRGDVSGVFGMTADFIKSLLLLSARCRSVVLNCFGSLK